jgi:hypothetical protein
MVRYHFITFATPDHMNFAKANLQTALETGRFDTAKIYTMDDIDDNYKKRNSHFFKIKRLAGYAVWKPYIILKRLLELEEGDVLCYNDSKYLWLKNVRVLENDILKDKEIGVYHNKPNSGTHIEKQWTKNDAFILMNIPNSNTEFGNFVRNSNQVWSGFIMLRISFETIRFIGEWLTYNQDYRISSDSATIFGKNDSSFTENRHDQTILSLLCKKWTIPMHFIEKTYMIDVRNPVI